MGFSIAFLRPGQIQTQCDSRGTVACQIRAYPDRSDETVRPSRKMHVAWVGRQCTNRCPVPDNGQRHRAFDTGLTIRLHRLDGGSPEMMARPEPRSGRAVHLVRADSLLHGQPQRTVRSRADSGNHRDGQRRDEGMRTSQTAVGNVSRKST